MCTLPRAQRQKKEEASKRNEQRAWKISHCQYIHVSSENMSICHISSRFGRFGQFRQFGRAHTAKRMWKRHYAVECFSLIAVLREHYEIRSFRTNWEEKSPRRCINARNIDCPLWSATQFGVPQYRNRMCSRAHNTFTYTHTFKANDWGDANREKKLTLQNENNAAIKYQLYG